MLSGAVLGALSGGGGVASLVLERCADGCYWITTMRRSLLSFSLSLSVPLCLFIFLPCLIMLVCSFFPLFPLLPEFPDVFICSFSNNTALAHCARVVCVAFFPPPVSTSPRRSQLFQCGDDGANAVSVDCGALPAQYNSPVPFSCTSARCCISNWR